jgi:peptidyl-prolyl cis-trans isomerase A (cyclophilin A)
MSLRPTPTAASVRRLLSLILLCAPLFACGDDAAPPAGLAQLDPGDYASIRTNVGDLLFRLDTERCPKTVANFAGLANGTRAFYDSRTGNIRTGHFYDGLLFFRFVHDFVIQGGSLNNTTRGEPGYRFEDEIDPDRSFHRDGLIAMANGGPDSNGSQFFVTLAPTPQIDGLHTIFGELMAGQETLDKLKDLPVNRFQKEQPLDEIVMKAVRVFTVAAGGRIGLTAMPDIERTLPQAQMPPSSATP